MKLSNTVPQLEKEKAEILPIKTKAGILQEILIQKDE
jgi:hypothetical protein